MINYNYEYYNSGYIEQQGYYNDFIKRNPEFDTSDFKSFVLENNKGDRDSDEIDEILKFEILRLAYEYEEYKRRFPNVYGEYRK